MKKIRIIFSLHPHNVGQRKGYFNNSINGSGEKMYTVDQMCNMVDVLADNMFVKFGGCFITLLESLLDPLQTNGRKFSKIYTLKRRQMNF